jgi:hypothetical protein
MNRIEKEAFKGLLYRSGQQTMVLGALLTVLNSEMPDLKQKMLAVLESTTDPSDTGQAMIDEAMDYVKSLK